MHFLLANTIFWYWHCISDFDFSQTNMVDWSIFWFLLVYLPMYGIRVNRCSFSLLNGKNLSTHHFPHIRNYFSFLMTCVRFLYDVRNSLWTISFFVTSSLSYHSTHWYEERKKKFPTANSLFVNFSNQNWCFTHLWQIEKTFHSITRWNVLQSVELPVKKVEFSEFSYWISKKLFQSKSFFEEKETISIKLDTVSVQKSMKIGF